MDKIQKDIHSRVAESFDETVALRRELHMQPELSQEEIQTSKIIARQLDYLGIPYEKEVAGHGIVATIYGRSQDFAVAIRADIDGLPLEEKTDVSFKSRNLGVMHGCGHDIHTAILLGTGKILNQLREELSGSVKLIFQPAEETVGGALPMINHGCLENPKVFSVIGLHVDPSIEAGKVQFVPQTMNAASCEFYVTVRGKSCHGAHPSEGIDALLPACAMVTSLESTVTKHFDAADPVLLTVSQFHGGTKNNIISGYVRFSGIIRTMNMENREKIKRLIETLCSSTASAFGASCSVIFNDSYPTLENNSQLLQLVGGSSSAILGKENVIVNGKASMGTDDFAYFCHHAKGLYYNLGCRRHGEDAAEVYPIHNDKFCPDEECIRTGMLTQIAAILALLEKEKPGNFPSLTSSL